MSRVGLWLGAAVFSAAGLVAAAFAVDGLTSDAALSLVPSIAIDGTPLVVGSPDLSLVVPDDAGADLSSLEPIPIDSGSAERRGSGSGAFVPVDDASGGLEVGGVTGVSGETEAAYPWEVEGTGLAPEAPQPFAGAGFSTRFIDACVGATAGCPFGIGGTVLAPGGSPGDFDIYSMSTIPDNVWRCRPGLVGDGAYPVLVVANQPARLEITYHPVGQPALARSVVVEADPAGPAYRDYQAAVERGETPVAGGVHHCWVLRAQAGDSFYQVEVRGTGLESDVDTLSAVVDVGGTRPPVWISARSDWELLIGVPVTSEPEQRSVVRVLYRSEGLSCSDIEAATLADASTVVAAPSFGGYQYREDVAEVIGTHDPAFDAYEYWSVSLQEGSGYLLCVWWVSTPGSSSFNPNAIAVDEREQRRIVAPDRYRVQVTTLGFSADRHPIGAWTIEVGVPEVCPEHPGPRIPFSSLRRGEASAMIQVVCGFTGVSLPPYVILEVDAPRPGPQAHEVVWVPLAPTPRCAADDTATTDDLLWSAQDLCRVWSVEVDGISVEFWVQYRRGEAVTNEVTLSGFADCTSGGVISIQDPGVTDRGTPSGGCGSWLIGHPVPFSDP